MTSVAVPHGRRPDDVDPREDIAQLLRDLGSSPDGLSDREVERRRIVWGPNVLTRSRGPGWIRQLLRQVTHPLALLLWLAAVLAWLSDSRPLAVAIVVVIVINAAFAFIQERHAERAVEALADIIPLTARVIRERPEVAIPAADLVPGDVIHLAEGDRVSADARLISGSVEVDLSALTGESVPVHLDTRQDAGNGPLVEATDIVFSGTNVVGGDCRAVVFATGMHTELGHIASMSQRVGQDRSPLEKQVVRVAWLIAAVAVGMGVAFVPLGTVLAGLSLGDSVNFSIGLLVANVPEGLLPTITLALAVGVRVLARSGALVKRISAVETLGSTTVICTDKTGTLTQNRMTVTRMWTPDGVVEFPSDAAASPAATVLAHTIADCCSATIDVDDDGHPVEFGDPTELALLRSAVAMGAEAPRAGESRSSRITFAFDPSLRRMSTVVPAPGGSRVNVKGAPEEILDRCTRVGGGRLGSRDVVEIRELVARWAAQGLRVLAVASRIVDGELRSGDLDRAEVERDLTLDGIVALMDPPREGVGAAVETCHGAGVRIMVVTGDHALTARGVAEQVGIGAHRGLQVITGADLDAMAEADLDDLLARDTEIVFARTSPEAKLRITDALRARGEVVAMTGDGVNDAPALHRSDIGVAMGRSGTEVAREAATMVLTDDDFSTIVTAVAAGRRVYDNVRKFIVYIFAHATPEVVPFLMYALSGGAIPLPLTVMQILAIDLGTETLPALALGREPAEPGLMQRAPRRRSQNVIDRALLVRAWALLGGVSAALVVAVFLGTLFDGGWRLGDPVTTGSLHHTWQSATTMTFLGIVACQLGTAMAARTHHASLRSVGPTSNRLLLWGFGFEIAVAAAIVTIPTLQGLFGTTTPPVHLLIWLVPMPLIVWGTDELVRWARRRRRGHRTDSSPERTAACPTS